MAIFTNQVPDVVTTTFFEVDLRSIKKSMVDSTAREKNRLMQLLVENWNLNNSALIERFRKLEQGLTLPINSIEDLGTVYETIDVLETDIEELENRMATNNKASTDHDS